VFLPTERWPVIFNLTIQGETVIVAAHMEGVGGITGDYSKNILPGEDFSGIPYELLRTQAEKEGWIELSEGTT
jgi:hypothetical protein